MKTLKNIFYISLVFLFPVLAYAQEPKLPGGGTVSLELKNPLKGANNFVELLGKIIDLALVVAVPIIVLAIIYAGFKFVAARGNETEINKAKTTFYYVIIGTAIILGARVLMVIIENTFKSLI